MSVRLSTSKNLVQDLGEMIAAKKKPKVFFCLLEKKNQINVIKEALDVVNLKVSGIISDEILYRTKEEFHDKMIRVDNYVFSHIPKYSLAEIAELSKTEKDIVIIVKNKASDFRKVVDIFENHNVNCHMYHFGHHIPDSAVVNGVIRVINRPSYLKKWPWFFDILNKDMTYEQKKNYDTKKITGRVVSNGKFLHYSDLETDVSIFKNGFRYADGYKPIEGKKKYTVTLVGDSRFVNAVLPTELTMATYLQKFLIDKNINCEVKNLSVMSNRFQNECAMIKSLDIDSDDIVICCPGIVENYYNMVPEIRNDEKRIDIKVTMMKDIQDYCHSKGAEIIFVYLPHAMDIPNLTPLESMIQSSYGQNYTPPLFIEEIKSICMANDIKMLDMTVPLMHSDRTALFIDITHFSPEGSKLVAQTMSRYIEQTICKGRLFNDSKIRELTDTAYAAHQKYAIEEGFNGLYEYVEELKKISEGKPDNSGVIVMNCNPFTLGHRYLIEQAAKQVDYLYIMAVEEDKSVFKFKDRFEMIKRGVADMENVEVIPSGKFVISSLTFPDYFDKSEKQDQTIDTTTDIEIFCMNIAPALKAKTRFAGNEPLDKVTNQYNMKMQELLPKYGMKFVEVLRKESGEAPISASRVRKLLNENKYDEAAQLLPKTTYDYLMTTKCYIPEKKQETSCKAPENIKINGNTAEWDAVENAVSYYALKDDKKGSMTKETKYIFKSLKSGSNVRIVAVDSENNEYTSEPVIVR